MVSCSILTNYSLIITRTKTYEDAPLCSYKYKFRVLEFHSRLIDSIEIYSMKRQPTFYCRQATGEFIQNKVHDNYVVHPVKLNQILVKMLLYAVTYWWFVMRFTWITITTQRFVHLKDYY